MTGDNISIPSVLPVTAQSTTIHWCPSNSQRWTIIAIRNLMRSGMSRQCSSCLLRRPKPRSYFRDCPPRSL